jgi:hypothetical protein
MSKASPKAGVLAEYTRRCFNESSRRLQRRIIIIFLFAKEMIV